ncbi:hypothetical protein BGZ51_007529 [Haplosporangium sp. Z 767]|nr:hypothetical protein BGZ51_007529 [Haplosporangium sp. Z 767]
MTMEDIKNRVRKIDGELCVLSFTHLDLFYKVFVNAQNMVIGCDCPYFLRLRYICKHILIVYRVYEAELLLPLQLVFRHAPRRPNVEPPVIEYDDTLLDLAHATVTTDKQEEKRQQDTLNLAALAALESLEKYVRASHCDRGFVDRLHVLVRQAEELPLKEDHFRKRRRQEY